MFRLFSETTDQNNTTSTSTLPFSDEMEKIRKNLMDLCQDAINAVPKRQYRPGTPGNIFKNAVTHYNDTFAKGKLNNFVQLIDNINSNADPEWAIGIFKQFEVHLNTANALIKKDYFENKDLQEIEIKRREQTILLMQGYRDSRFQALERTSNDLIELAKQCIKACDELASLANPVKNKELLSTFFIKLKAYCKSINSKSQPIFDNLNESYTKKNWDELKNNLIAFEIDMLNAVVIKKDKIIAEASNFAKEDIISSNEFSSSKRLCKALL